MATSDLEARIEQLERRMAELERKLRELSERQGAAEGKQAVFYAAGQGS